MSKKWEEEGSQPARGEGWWGHGAPIRVRQGYKIRDLEDGAGLCSPGRWTPASRRLPFDDSFATKLVSAMELDTEKWDKFLVAMLAGKLPESPFTTSELAKGAAYLEKWAKDQGQTPTLATEDIEQAPKLRLLQALLRCCNDPDAEALDAFCGGVRLGYLQRMPRTLAVFKEKERWRLHYEDPGPP